MDHVVLVEKILCHANPNTIKNKFSIFGEICSVGLHYNKLSRRVRNGYAFVKYKQACSAQKAVKSSGNIKVGSFRVDVCMLADAANEHPFFEAMSSATSEEPMFSSFIGEKSIENSKVVESVIHLLQNQNYQNTFLGTFKRSLVVKDIDPTQFDAATFNQKVHYLAKTVNFNIFWDYSSNTGFALVEFKSYLQAKKIIRFLDNSEICGTKVRIMRPQSLFSSVDFTDGMCMKNPLSFSSGSSSLLSTESYILPLLNDTSPAENSGPKTVVPSVPVLQSKLSNGESTYYQQACETGEVEHLSKPVSECQQYASNESPIQLGFDDVIVDKIGTSTVSDDVMREKPKSTDVTFKVLSNRTLDVKFHKVELEDRVVLKIFV